MIITNHNKKNKKINGLRKYSGKHHPVYNDEKELDIVLNKLKTFLPLVFTSKQAQFHIFLRCRFCGAFELSVPLIRLKVDSFNMVEYTLIEATP